MAIVSIVSQPSTDDLKAAFRPIVFVVRASRTDSNPVPPLVYCDIYVNGVFYKTQEKTQYKVLNETDSDWQFDIQDACQEVLFSSIKANGGTDIIQDTDMIKQVYCKFRSSGYDSNGFILPEGTIPVQGTGTVSPTSGTGTQSNSFYVLNGTLQHQQNQDLKTHLGYFKGDSSDWDMNMYPLTHRGTIIDFSQPNSRVPLNPQYKVCQGNSDYYPVVYLGTDSISCIGIMYTLKGDTSEFGNRENNCGGGGGGCVGVGYGEITTPAATSGTAYSQNITSLSGTGPFTLASFSAPGWITASIVDGYLHISGTPSDGDIGTGISLSFTVTNACGTVGIAASINVLAACVGISYGDTTLGGATSGSAYSADIPLLGTAPFTLGSFTGPGWMSASIVGSNLHLSGTPGDSDAGTGIAISFTVTNACGSADGSTTINVAVVPRTLTFSANNHFALPQDIYASLNAVVDVDITISSAFADGFTSSDCGGEASCSSQIPNPSVITAGNFTVNGNNFPSGDWTTANSYRIYNLIINGSPRSVGDVVTIGSYSVTILSGDCS